MPFTLPPLQLSNSSGSGLNSGGTNFMASGPGDWNVNLAGSGTSTQGLSAGSGSGLKPWMLIAAGLVALYIVTKK
jgi:hypothetical protein